MLYVCIPYTPDRRERLLETIASIQQTTHEVNYCIVTHENDYLGWPNAVLDMIEGIDDLVFLLESDAIVKEGCIDMLYKTFMEKFSMYHDGIVEPFNEFHHGNLIQHPMCHANMLRGTIHRGYFHNFADNEMNDRMKSTGNYIYVPQAKMEHKHFLNGKALQDESYKKVLNQERFEKDRELYINRRNKNFNE